MPSEINNCFFINSNLFRF